MIWAILLILVGCVEQNINQQDPIKLEFNNSYHDNILSYWEKMIEDKNYSYVAYERYRDMESKVQVNVSKDNYNIIVDVYGDDSFVYYAYKNNTEYYCVRVLNNYLNCTTKDVFKIAFSNYGGDQIFNYIFNKSVLEAEKKYLDNLMSINLSINRVDNTYILYFGFQNITIEDATKLGYRLSDLGKYIAYEARFNMDRGNYEINSTIVTISENITRDLKVNITLGIDDVGKFPLEIEKYNRIDIRNTIDLITTLALVKSGHYKEEDIYKMAVSKNIPELCLQTNKPRLCLSFYVSMTNRFDACKLIGESC